MTSFAPAARPDAIRRWTLRHAASEMTGPMRLPLAGSPGAQLSATSFAIAQTSSMRAFGTSMRVGARQDWPEFIITLLTPPVIAAFRSASSSTMFGLLPPSSWCTRLTVAAALRATSMPARVEPVIEIMSMPGWLAIALPTTGPTPKIMLNTPGGTPQASMISVRICAENGATSEGFSTTVQPTASAGAVFAHIWCTGQFHGVMKPHTPIGSLSTAFGPFNSSKA